MSTGQMPDPVQPEGQGGGGNEAPYAEYLNRIPEAVRSDVEPVFKEWDANVTQRFQDAAEYRKTWEPYEQIGVSQQPPEVVEWLMQFYDAHNNNPQAVVEWAQGYAQEHGLALAEAAQEEEQFGYDALGYDPQQLEKLLEAKLGPLTSRFEQFEQWQQQQEQAARMSQAEHYIEGQLKELEQKHGQEFDREAIDPFLARYVETDPRNAVPKAWNDYQAFKARIEKGFVGARESLGQPPEGSGPADARPPQIKSLADANAIAGERIREMMRNR